ncbi:cyclodeaminase/cyclohydrolase family protein [Actinopolymorpha alba]|uniref:cyclodeaminase/cyclohydrolase family protein n=1 Tax=Actinopolymorpha alba TaxID=533267 RepID=UPI0003798AC4|nr:cyclodeaminase/cyclohydrolase family protein [Actinopolymorpha alba]
MYDETLGTWLDQLGSSAPAPGGGAAAAMNAAIGAALISMVANLTIGKAAYAAHEEHATNVRTNADALRERALQLAANDAEAFDALMATFRLPRTTDAEKATRTAAIQEATEAAARVPLRIAETAAEVIRLAQTLPGRSNPNVLSDVAVAAASAAAALESAALNVEINLRSLRDEAVKESLTASLTAQTGMLDTASTLIRDVRQEINR